MNNNENIDEIDELDKAIAQSVEKLVSEETSVARAFVDISGESTENKNESKLKTQDLTDVTKLVKDDTRPIPQVTPSVKKKRNTSGEKPQPKAVKQSKKQNKALVVLVTGVIFFAVVLMLVISIVLDGNKKKSFDYTYSKGLEAYNAGNYSEAIEYWEKSSKDLAGKKNIDLKLKMYEAYIAINQKDKAVDILKDALNYDKYNEKVLTTLAKYYSDSKDGNALSELLAKYHGTDGEKYLKAYEVEMPTASESSGKYDKTLELELKAVNSYKIYYTIDGSSVTTASKLYSEPIRLEKGTTTVKAVAVNSMGTMSAELELQFVIDYKNPDSPIVTPVTGSYAAGTKITITNIPDGGKAYYTLDGKNPTKESTEYKEAFDMPEGNFVFAAIIVDSNGTESSVTKRNYNVGVTTKYTFDESIEHLKVVMMAKDDLNKDGTSADGGQAKFTYYRKTSIAGVEMYITFYDIVKNGVTTRQNYYFGVDVATGKCYKVYDQGGTLIATEY